MKIFIMIFCCCLFIQDSHGQTFVKFLIDEHKNIKVLIADNIIETPIGNISIIKGESIGIKVEANNSVHYKLRISRAGQTLKEYGESDFAGDKSIITQGNLKLDTFYLSHKFRIQINIGSPPFSKEFNVVTNNENTSADGSLNHDAKKQPADETLYTPGIPYYDALALTDPKTTGQDIVLDIIRHYFNNPNLQQRDIPVVISTNPFLSKANIDISTFKSIAAMDTGAQSSISGILSNVSASSIGGLDVTNIADGFSKFLVKRTKQELSIAFFEKFKNALADTNARDLRSVFPQTYRALTIIGDEIYNYDAYIQTLRESFENDLASLTINLPTVVDNHPVFFAKFPWLEATLKSGCYISTELRDKVHPGNILKDYPTDYLDKLNKNCKGAIQTAQLVSESLRDSSQSDTVYWVSPKQIKSLVKDSTAFRIYLGLVYQQALQSPYDSIRFQGTTLINILKQVADSFFAKREAYKIYIVRFGEKANKINTLLINYSNTENDSIKFEQYTNYFTAFIDFLQYTTETGKLPYVNLPHLNDTLKDYFDVARSTCDLVLDINRRNYGAAITNAVHVYDLILVKPEPLNGNDEVLHRFFKYGTFMATIVQATSSDEVENAIEVVALPAGSSRIKRETLFGVSLNAYTGLFLGSEKTKGLDAKYKVNSWGVTAPIGIAISGGKTKFFGSKTLSGHNSWSLFFSLVDLGAVTAFRFSNDSADAIPTVKLRDIVSPGFFASFGLGKTPLSINFGYQSGPRLRTVNESLINIAENRYERISLSLCVDIPIFNFYTKSKSD